MFPTRTAKKEVGRRKDERLRRGEEDGRAQAGVVDEFSDELIKGRGVEVVLPKHEAEDATLDPRKEGGTSAVPP